jgi:predicted deacylase
MAEIFRMPRMSDTMEEGVVASWLKKVGDSIAAGDVIAEVETDKATMELESYDDGVLLYFRLQILSDNPCYQIRLIRIFIIRLQILSRGYPTPCQVGCS